MSEFDIKLESALILAFDKKWDIFENEMESEYDYVFTENYNKKVLKKSFKALNSGRDKYYSIRLNKRNAFYGGRLRIKKAVLVVILIVTMLMSTLTAYAITHPEIIYSIKKNIIEWVFSFPQIDQENESNKFIAIMPETPKGFEIIIENEVPDLSYDIQYGNKAGKEVFYSQEKSDNYILKISGEGDEYKEIVINNFGGYAYHQNNNWTIIWSDGNYAFKITGNVEYAIILKMAESVKC